MNQVLKFIQIPLLTSLQLTPIDRSKRQSCLIFLAKICIKLSREGKIDLTKIRNGQYVVKGVFRFRPSIRKEDY